MVVPCAFALNPSLRADEAAAARAVIAHTPFLAAPAASQPADELDGTGGAAGPAKRERHAI